LVGLENILRIDRHPWKLLTCIKVLPSHGGVDIRGSEIKNFDKIVKPITENQCNGNKNLQQQNEKTNKSRRL